MKLVTFFLITAVTLAVSYIDAQDTTGQDSPVQTPSSGQSEIWKKLARLHNRVFDVHSDVNAKNNVIDDFVAAEGQTLFQELIERIKEGFYSRNELQQVAEVMARIKPSPEDKLIALINEEDNPNQKAMLIYCLGSFDSSTVISTLRQALDDTRPIKHPPRSFEGAPWPVGSVCIEAYEALLPKIERMEGAKSEPLIPWWKISNEEGARRIKDLKTRMKVLGY